MNAEVDGERLTAQEFGSFFILLVVAGNETTRNAISHGMKLLTDNPDQRKIWFDDFDTHTKSAVEEIVRFATPVIHFRRTVTQDTDINGFPVTNVLFQVGTSELPFNSIAQAQILTGGFGAEFGRSTGGVINIQTKSGTNTWEAGGSISTEPS